MTALLHHALGHDPFIGYPDLTATPAGGLYAEWPGAHGGRATIEFLASGEPSSLSDFGRESDKSLE